MRLGLSEEQIAARQSFIGGSDAGAIVAGGEEWVKLWREKTGRSQPENLSNVLAVQMGSFTEPLNAHWFEKMTGRSLMRRGETVIHPDFPYIGANLDGIAMNRDGNMSYVDFKHVGKSGDQLTVRYTAQCTHASLILGLDHWMLSTFIGNSKWELTEQEVDPFFAAEYLDKCAQFWSFVETDVEPPPDIGVLPVPAPKKLRTVALEAQFGTPEWGGMLKQNNWAFDFINELDIWARTRDAHTAHNIAQAEIKKLLPEDVGTVTRGLLKVARDKAGAVRVSLAKEKP